MALGTRKSGAVISTTDNHPTLLRTPGQYGFPNERILPGRPETYSATPSGDWVLITCQQGRIVYFGPGPANVVLSPAPF